ncbi:Alpha-galactosidase [Salix suchowensis]|nr:Alpha-galactosidase [Salix suchowensis]
MRDALARTGRPSSSPSANGACKIPLAGLQAQSATLGEFRGSPVLSSELVDLTRYLYRNDIGPPASWDNLFRIINQLVPFTGFAGPGAWNDLDMLEVGNTGLTVAEQQTHFAFWAAAKFTATVAAHGIVVVKVTDGVPVIAPSFAIYQAASGVLSGGASVRTVNSTVSVVGFVGNGGTLLLPNVDGGVSGGTKLLAIDYINADFVFSNTDCSNCRNALISVNGGTPVTAQMPISGQGTWCLHQDLDPGKRTPSKFRIRVPGHQTSSALAFLSNYILQK